MSTETKVDQKSIVSNTLALILAGGRGSRLFELTDRRAKPAVYFGGVCRIIDFTLSNCINSGFRKIGIVTQYMSHSLLKHLQYGWSFVCPDRGEFVDMIPAMQQLHDETWYRGTADAVYQNLNLYKSQNIKYVVILAGDHIYKMDYSKMLADHIESGAKCTVGCIEVEKKKASEFGVMGVNEKLQVKEFVEKPKNPPSILNKPDFSLASMGIYIFDIDYLIEALAEEEKDPKSEHDFGKNIIPKAMKKGVLYAHPFERSCMGRNTDGQIYWRDVGTIDAYWEANIDLVTKQPKLDMYDNNWPIRTAKFQVAPSKYYYDGMPPRTIDNSLISYGCIITNAAISNSVISHKVTAFDNASIEYSVVLPSVVISKGCKLNRCIIDRGVILPEGIEIGYNKELDAKRFRVSPAGIVLVTQKMLDAIKPTEQTSTKEEKVEKKK